MPNIEATMNRLDGQKGYYSKSSAWNKKWYLWLKTVEIASAALIPFLINLGDKQSQLLLGIAGALGAVVVILEGVQGVFQFHHNWTSYRTTSEALKHEKHLFEASAGPYRSADNPETLLAERIEAIISQENKTWVSVFKGDDKGGKQGG